MTYASPRPLSHERSRVAPERRGSGAFVVLGGACASTVPRAARLGLGFAATNARARARCERPRGRGCDGVPLSPRRATSRRGGAQVHIHHRPGWCDDGRGSCRLRCGRTAGAEPRCNARDPAQRCFAPASRRGGARRRERVRSARRAPGCGRCAALRCIACGRDRQDASRLRRPYGERAAASAVRAHADRVGARDRRRVVRQPGRASRRRCLGARERRQRAAGLGAGGPRADRCELARAQAVARRSR